MRLLDSGGSWAASGENMSVSAESGNLAGRRFGEDCRFLPMVMSGIAKGGQLPGAGTDLTAGIAKGTV